MVNLNWRWVTALQLPCIANLTVVLPVSMWERHYSNKQIVVVFMNDWPSPETFLKVSCQSGWFLHFMGSLWVSVLIPTGLIISLIFGDSFDRFPLTFEVTERPPALCFFLLFSYFGNTFWNLCYFWQCNWLALLGAVWIELRITTPERQTCVLQPAFRVSNFWHEILINWYLKDISWLHKREIQ